TTWGDWNPGCPVQPIRQRDDRSKQLTNAEKATKEMKARARKKVEDAINKRLEKIDNLVETQIDELVEESGISKQKMRSLAYHTSKVAHERNMSVYNTYVANKTRTLNEIKKMINWQQEKLLLTPEDEEKLLWDANQKKALKKTGIHGNHHACLADSTSTVQRMGNEAGNLYLRTGTHSFTFTTRGHSDDQVIPGFYATPGVEKFFKDVLHLTHWQISALFEHWCCLEEHGEPYTENLDTLRAECRRYIGGGLHTHSPSILLIHLPNKKMNYENYDAAIVAKHKVRLEGWPEGIDFGSPANIMTVDEARKLRDALKHGTCKWVILDEEQLNTRGKENTINPMDVHRKHKPRSDKGKTRGPNKRTKDISKVILGTSSLVQTSHW
ncbi:hypothetical protein BDN72DRAFT_913392, partial [Pluteus cervinus]